MSAPRDIRVAFSRHELTDLLDALECIIEDFKYDGGLRLAEDHIALEGRLKERLRRYDGGRGTWGAHYGDVVEASG